MGSCGGPFPGQSYVPAPAKAGVVLSPANARRNHSRDGEINGASFVCDA